MTNEIRKPNDETRTARPRLTGFGFRHSSFFRHLAFVIRHSALLFSLAAALAQKPSDRPAPLDPIQGEREARTLVGEMLAQTPEQNVTNTGVLTIRDGEGNRREL